MSDDHLYTAMRTADGPVQMKKAAVDLAASVETAISEAIHQGQLSPQEVAKELRDLLKILDAGYWPYS